MNMVTKIGVLYSKIYLINKGEYDYGIRIG